MSEDTWETDIGERDFAQESGCPYGFEFCEDPTTRDLGLCTTDCDTYMDEVEEQAKKEIPWTYVKKLAFGKEIRVLCRDGEHC